MVQTNSYWAFNLASHDYYGPFETNDAGIEWGKKHISCFTMTTRLPAHAVPIDPAKCAEDYRQ